MTTSHAFIHPKAHVDESVRLGKGTKVWQFASVTRGTVLGEDCVVWPLSLLDGAVFGDRCKIASGVAIGPGFKIGSDVFIGPSVTFANDMWPRASIDGFDEARLRSGTEWAVIVEDCASIGANAVILPGVRIGRGAIVAANAVVDRNVPDGMLWRRNGMLTPKPDQLRKKRMRFVAEPAGLAAAAAVAHEEGTSLLNDVLRQAPVEF